MRMLVLGAGQQGAACAYDLLTHSGHDVVLADRSFQKLPDFLAPHLDGRLRTLSLDAGDANALASAMEGVSATMSALPYYHNPRLAEAALAAGSHFCDLGGNTEIVREQMTLAASARGAGLSVVPDCGLAPGMVNILAGQGIRMLSPAREVHMQVGGLPQNPRPPLNYQIVYSLEGVIDYYTTPSWILREGRPVQVEALSEVEETVFSELGRLEAFHTAGGLSLMAQRHAGSIERMEYKTLRYPGHAAAMKMIRELGLFSTNPVEVKGRPVVPRDAFIAIAGQKLRRDPRSSPDIVALRVEVTGDRDGQPMTLRWELIDRYDAATGLTAMARTTGFSLSITGLLQAGGRLPAGAWTPDEVVPPDEYIGELEKRGVVIRFRAC